MHTETMPAAPAAPKAAGPGTEPGAPAPPGAPASGTAPQPAAAAPHPAQKLAAAAVAAGGLLLALTFLGAPLGAGSLVPALTFGMLAAGGCAWFWLRYRGTTPGIRHDGMFSGGVTARGAAAWGLAVVLTGFYVMLYWAPRYLEGGVRLVDPLARAFGGQPADRWFLYGFLYTAAMLVFGVRMVMKYRHNRYQLARTGSVFFMQLGFAFLLPHVLRALNQPEFYFTYFWPLKYDLLFPGSVHGLLAHPGGLGVFLLIWGAAMTFVATPILTYFFGKRWYCSWVCGCGGLAETLGDPFRQLSSKSRASWRLERWSIHTVLVLVTLTTALLWLNEARGGALLGAASLGFRRFYGFFIGALFAGVVGVGFYPLLGSRIWCRFGCPMAAALGILQRYLSRFRITTNGGQCISCGNCSTYCEMGIDVRAYAQRGENIVRASCVGCGVCSAVCPRGVLKLENGSTHADRYPGARRPLRAALESLGWVGRTRGAGSYGMQ